MSCFLALFCSLEILSVSFSPSRFSWCVYFVFFFVVVEKASFRPNSFLSVTSLSLPVILDPQAGDGKSLFFSLSLDPSSSLSSILYLCLSIFSLLFLSSLKLIQPLQLDHSFIHSLFLPFCLPCLSFLLLLLRLVLKFAKILYSIPDSLFSSSDLVRESLLCFFFSCCLSLSLVCVCCMWTDHTQNRKKFWKKRKNEMKILFRDTGHRTHRSGDIKKRDCQEEEEEEDRASLAKGKIVFLSSSSFLFSFFSSIQSEKLSLFIRLLYLYCVNLCLWFPSVVSLFCFFSFLINVPVVWCGFLSSLFFYNRSQESRIEHQVIQKKSVYCSSPSSWCVVCTQFSPSLSFSLVVKRQTTQETHAWAESIQDIVYKLGNALSVTCCLNVCPEFSLSFFWKSVCSWTDWYSVSSMLILKQSHSTNFIPFFQYFFCLVVKPGKNNW